MKNVWKKNPNKFLTACDEDKYILVLECLHSSNTLYPAINQNDLNRASPLSQTQYFYVVLFKGMRVAQTHNPPIQNKC